MKFFRQAALCAAILSSLTGSALAQGLGGNASISATTSSGSSPVQFPLAGAANQNSFTSAIIAPAATVSPSLTLSATTEPPMRARATS